MEDNHTHATHGEHKEHEHHHHNTFWVESQVSLTFRFPGDMSPDILQDIKRDVIQSFLDKNEPGFMLDDKPLDVYVFPEFGTSDLDPEENDLDPEESSLDEDKWDAKERLVVAFFRFEGRKSADHQELNPHGHGDRDLSKTPVVQLVNLINNSLEELRGNGVPIASASPNWLCGGSDNVATGCPLLPPIPVPPGSSHVPSPGRWPIGLPKLPSEIQTKTGDEVTVFVMDSLPDKNTVLNAAQRAGMRNRLLQDLAVDVRFHRPTFQVPAIDMSGPNQVGTGKDTKGQAMIFSMPDHGLFVAGIIHDIAPQAKIECIRILSDKGVGDIGTLIKELKEIVCHVSPGGKLYDKDVVVNLSMVTATIENIKSAKFDPVQVRLALYYAIKYLIARGVVVVAAAGNEADPRPHGKQSRPEALYPAAFAYSLSGQKPGLDNVIPVGAVNYSGEATSYSCYPGKLGVATYGGEIPSQADISAGRLDALIGVYSREVYPRLLKTDQPERHPAPDTHGWAYWVGTSFATPIVTALVARALEWKRDEHRNVSIRKYIREKVATDKTDWAPTATHHHDARGRVIIAKQPKP